jgi:hypothetical protein
MQASHSFIIDGEEKAGYLPVALDKVLDELYLKMGRAGLTLKVKDVTIERNPHGRGMWNYTVKVNSE